MPNDIESTILRATLQNTQKLRLICNLAEIYEAVKDNPPDDDPVQGYLVKFDGQKGAKLEACVLAGRAFTAKSYENLY